MAELVAKPLWSLLRYWHSDCAQSSLAQAGAGSVMCVYLSPQGCEDKCKGDYWQLKML